MPVEIIFAAEEIEFSLPTVPDGEVISLTDYTPGAERILLIGSLPVGGFVLSDDINNAVLSPDGVKRLHGGLASCEPVCDIPVTGEQVPLVHQPKLPLPAGRLLLRYVVDEVSPWRAFS